MRSRLLCELVIVFSSLSAISLSRVGRFARIGEFLPVSSLSALVKLSFSSTLSVLDVLIDVRLQVSSNVSTSGSLGVTSGYLLGMGTASGVKDRATVGLPKGMSFSLQYSFRTSRVSSTEGKTGSVICRYCFASRPLTFLARWLITFCCRNVKRSRLLLISFVKRGTYR